MEPLKPHTKMHFCQNFFKAKNKRFLPFDCIHRLFCSYSSTIFQSYQKKPIRDNENFKGAFRSIKNGLFSRLEAILRIENSSFGKVAIHAQDTYILLGMLTYF